MPTTPSTVAIADDTIDLEIAPGVVTTWMKLAIRDRILPDDDIDEELNEDLDKDVDDVAGERRVTNDS